MAIVRYHAVEAPTGRVFEDVSGLGPDWHDSPVPFAGQRYPHPHGEVVPAIVQMVDLPETTSEPPRESRKKKGSR